MVGYACVHIDGALFQPKYGIEEFDIRAVIKFSFADVFEKNFAKPLYVAHDLV
jgi:hypothetical protein